MLNTLLYDPTLNRLSREMDRLLCAAPAAARQAPSRLALNAWREGDTIVVEAEVPGVKMEDIEVLATETGLTIRASRERCTPENATALRLERVTHLERSIELPIEIDAERTNARLEDGVLRVAMPIAERARPRRVQVNGAGQPAVVNGARASSTT